MPPPPVAPAALQDKYGLSPVAAAVAGNHRAIAKALEDEACRSSDFQKRDATEAAYKANDKTKKPVRPMDVNEVPQKFSEGTRGAGGQFSMADSDDASGRGSPGSPSARRRRSEAMGVEGVGGEAGDGLADGEEKVVKFLDPGRVEDPDMKELINNLNRELTRKAELDSDQEDRVSLGSSLGSEYEFDEQ